MRGPVNQILKSKIEAERLANLAPIAQERAAKAFGDTAKTSEGVRAGAKPLQASAEKARAAADKIQIGLTKLDEAQPKEIASHATKLADNLRLNNMIGDEQYRSLLKQIQETDRAYGKTEKARSIIKTLLSIAGAGAAATFGIHLVGH